MPPKTTITREQVESAAFELLRTEGPDAITARRIAQQLGCSTQPVYTACGSMTSVKEQVELRAEQFIGQFLQRPMADEPAYVRIGLATLRLAHDEPHLFAVASKHMREHSSELPPEPVLAAMRADERLAAMSVEQLIRVNTLMTFFAQGVATLVAPGASQQDLAAAEAYLRRAGEAVIAYEAGQG